MRGDSRHARSEPGLVPFHNKPPEEKQRRSIRPYLTLPLTKACTFRCAYCGEGGELTTSRTSVFDLDHIRTWLDVGRGLGITKFRLTGGEPLLHPRIGNILDLFRETTDYLLVNSNGDLLVEREPAWRGLPSNVHFAVSLDSLNEGCFERITRSSGRFGRVLQGIEMLAQAGLLLRINMVIHRQNCGEVFQMIDECGELGCNLKLLDVVSVPHPFGQFSDHYVDTRELEVELRRRAASQALHEYASSFGTPCRVFMIDGVAVTLKSIRYGSRFDTEGICRGCKYFPCHEGLYDMFVLPDGRAFGCRWSASSLGAGCAPRERLDSLISAFQRADWICTAEMRSMPRLETLF